MTDAYDLVISGGTVVIARETLRAGIGVVGGRIAAVGESLKAVVHYEQQ